MRTQGFLKPTYEISVTRTNAKHLTGTSRCIEVSLEIHAGPVSLFSDWQRFWTKEQFLTYMQDYAAGMLDPKNIESYAKWLPEKLT